MKKQTALGLLLFCAMLSSSCFAASDLPASNSLTVGEKELLNRGEMHTAQYVTGGIIGTVLGFGIGNLVQETYAPYGPVFTAGELTGLTLFVAGEAGCFVNQLDNLATNHSNNSKCLSPVTIAGGILYAGLHLWEIIDVWTTPLSNNRKIREIRERTGINSVQVGLLPLTDPKSSSLHGGQLSLSFQF